MLEWGRLRGWLEAKREDVQPARRLAAATSEWLEAGQDPSILLRGDRRRGSRRGWPFGDGADREERAFSTRASPSDRRPPAEAARAAREAVVERRSKRRLQAMVALFATFALVAGVLTAVAVGFQRRSALDARVANGRELAAAAVANLDVDPERSILLALEGVEGPTASTRPSRGRSGRRSTGRSALPPGGRRCRWAGGSRSATTGRASPRARGRRRHRVGPAGRDGAGRSRTPGRRDGRRVDPAGRDLATLGADGTVRIWDADRRPAPVDPGAAGHR